MDRESVLKNDKTSYIPRVAIYNLGCKVNQYEAEAMSDEFRQARFKIVDFSREADIYIINSCAVTTSAASKSRKRARRAKRRGGEDCLVIMAGCYSQVSPAEVEEIEEIDYIIGSDEKDSLVEKVIRLFSDQKWKYKRQNYQEMNSYPEFQVKEVDNRTRANIKIQDGCSQFCSYCIIPYARGQKRSRSSREIIAEVKRLKAEGVKEFVLTGIHLGAYGDDFTETGDHLAVLLQKLVNISGQFRIRLSSIEINEITENILQLMAASDKICPHLHIPMQSGSDEILAEMNRPYTGFEFAERIDWIREKIPDIAISTDVMVGFPGESKKNFKETYNLLKTIQFSRVHVFSYSPRPGTEAAEMSGQIDSEIKKERSQEMRKLGNRLKNKYEADFLEQKLEILFERKNEDGTFSGYSENYIRVRTASEQDLTNSFQKVKLAEVRDKEENMAILATRG